MFVVVSNICIIIWLYIYNKIEDLPVDINLYGLDNGAAQLVAARPGVVHSFTQLRSESQIHYIGTVRYVRTHCHYAFARERMSIVRSNLICSPVAVM